MLTVVGYNYCEHTHVNNRVMTIFFINAQIAFSVIVL